MKTYLVVLAILFSGCGLSSADFRYLYNIMGMYAADNFEYPVSADDILSYCDAYKAVAPDKSGLGSRDVWGLNMRAFRRIAKDKNLIEIINTDSLYGIIYKNDTVFVNGKQVFVCNVQEGYADIDKYNVRTYILDVAMYTSQSSPVSITDENLLREFNFGLYAAISKRQPSFWQNRMIRKPFNVEVLEYSDGNLHPKCPQSSFNVEADDCYELVGRYVRDFAETHNLSRIIFKYIYDK